MICFLMFFMHTPIADIIKKFVCYDKAFVAKISFVTKVLCCRNILRYKNLKYISKKYILFVYLGNCETRQARS